MKNIHKGPEVWNARIVRLIPGPSAIPRDECWLLMARDALTGEMKYFLSNAPRETAPEVQLHIASNRWRIERLFEDGKSHVGLDHLEVRNYQPMMRHLILSMLSLLFVVKQTHRLREKNARWTVRQARMATDAQLDPTRSPAAHQDHHQHVANTND